MARVHTHYENLKVARNAPPEVIRAAYRVLSQKYHPDKHDQHPDAQRVMALINQAFEVLSDPQKRAEHDAWIAREERGQAPPPALSAAASRAQQPYAEPRPKPPPEDPRDWKAIAGVVGGLALAVAFYNGLKSPSPARPPVAAPLQYSPADTLVLDPAPPSRKEAAPTPSGNWPAKSGYLAGQPVLANGGLSKLTIDNSRNDADVYVKVHSVDRDRPVRHLFIKAGGSFTAAKMDPGTYEVRYKDLSSGSISASKPFELVQVETETGTRYSTVSMTLYKVAQGNMPMRRLSESEF